MRRDHENTLIRWSQRRQRAASALIPLSLATTLAVTTLGCSGDFTSGSAQSTDSAENALIVSHLAGRGFDTSTLLFEGDEVIVEDDMVMSRPVLLEAAEAEASGVVEKGYFFSTQNTLFAGKRIQVSFAADVSATWRTAYNAAVAEWNSKTPMFSRDPGGAATISVVMGSIMTTAIARGGFPPERTITLNRSFSDPENNCLTLEGLPANVKANSALHEIGHVLGFEHPQPISEFGILIPGTEANTGTGDAVSYSTVMVPGCTQTLTRLSPDDILSATKKYPSCVTTCENNCLGQIDPGEIGLCQSSCLRQCGG